MVGPSLGTSVEALWSACAAELAGEYDVVGWDLPGHGRSRPVTEAFTVAELAAGVLALADGTLRARGTPAAPFAYAGDSLGGAVGLQLLLDAPRRVAEATLIATGGRIATPESWRERASLVRSSGTRALVDSTPARWFAPGFAEPVAGELLAALDGRRTTRAMRWPATRSPTSTSVSASATSAPPCWRWQVGTTR